MSANTLLVNGKINPSLIPAGVVPENPVFQSVSINNTSGADASSLILSHPDADSQFIIQKDDAGVVDFIQLPSTGTGTTFITVNGFANEMVIGGVDNLQLNGETVVDVVSPVVNLGDPDEASPLVQIIGDGATGRVFDDQFNQPYDPPINLLTGGTQIITGNTQISGNNITPNRSAMAFLSLQFSCAPGIATIGDAGIEYYLDGPGTTVAQNSWNTVLPAELAVPVVSPAIYNFGYSHTVYLLKDAVYTLVIKPYGSGWNGVVVSANISMLNA
jgi:hypothetical protein